MSAFRDVFRFMMEEGTRRKYTLVFDEFQNFLEINPSIYSDIQNWWDKYQKESHVNMVVSGSVYSLMEKLFKTGKNPFTGDRIRPSNYRLSPHQSSNKSWRTTLRDTPTTISLHSILLLVASQNMWSCSLM